MKVTIVIPVFNVSDYIERCVKSVMNQTYSNIEAIIVNDCTPDDSIEKCETLLAQYQGSIDFKIVKHARNRGLSAARNTGTDIATGEYVYYLDSDDEITPDCISLMVAEVHKHPGVEMVLGNIQSVPNYDYYDVSYSKNPCYIDDNCWVRYNFLKCGEALPVTAWNKLTKLSFIRSNHLSFLEGLIHEDELWMHQVSMVLRSISIIEQKTYIYYETVNSIMSSLTKISSAKNMSIILHKMANSLNQPFYDLQLYRIMFFYFNRFAYLREYPEFHSLSYKIFKGLIHIKDYRVAAMFLGYVGLFPILKGRHFKRLPNRKACERYVSTSNRYKYQQTTNQLVSEP